MSGGHFDYVDARLKDEIFGWDDKFSNQFEDREISELVWDVLNLIHEFDWYKSGDTCEETYLKAKAAFKKKWFGDYDTRLAQIVEYSLDEFRDELRKIFYPFGKGNNDG